MEKNRDKAYVLNKTEEANKKKKDSIEDWYITRRKETRDTKEVAAREQASLLLFLEGARGSKVPFLSCFYSILATVFQPENTTENTLCL